MKKKYTFKPGWLASISVALLLPLFISLGFWQLRRADEKQNLMDERIRHESEVPLQLTADFPLEGHRFRPVTVRGTFDATHQLLLDNQIYNHQPGYHVLTPLRLPDSDLAVLVNRGWIPLGDRHRLPELPIAQIEVQFTGLLDRFPQVGFRLEGADVPAPGWPSVVQILDADRLAERLGYRLLPYQVLLPAAEAAGYVRDWRPVDLHPEKSQGYAVQWFSFAAVLFALYLWYGFKAQRVTPPDAP
ncbi:SURF1 family protein [Methylococcus sp. EFPC2]|uniref:SURF1 family protein n=1 Tax=Methylococcus sp. EFPC2 TaxID=2812648 RepID=UPI0019670D2E|nr:SURF1 family protein [Methylococcus sp. EFPC2]QSA95884.1 SURF1 family protein [Methylococcus sp. EFPC2]